MRMEGRTSLCIIIIFYVFVRRSVSSGEHSVPGADDGRAGSNGGIITGGGNRSVRKRNSPSDTLCAINLTGTELG